jgi:hypothetical protein
MTPTELETYVRQRYNAVGDTFYPQAEIFNFFYQAQMELAMETKCIKNIYTTTSTASQRSYDMPTNCISIARMEYDGKRIFPNDFIDDDALTGNNPNETVTGTPINYQVFGSTFFLRPTPTDADTIKIYSYDAPNQPSTTVSLSVPVRYHLMLSDFALFCMFAQDKNNTMADYHARRWEKSKELVQETERMRMVDDQYRIVKDHEDLVHEPFRY